MSCLADSNLTAIREGRAADLLAGVGEGGGHALMFGGGTGWRRRCDVCYPSHVNQPLVRALAMRVCGGRAHASERARTGVSS